MVAQCSGRMMVRMVGSCGYPMAPPQERISLRICEEPDALRYPMRMPQSFPRWPEWFISEWVLRQTKENCGAQMEPTLEHGECEASSVHRLASSIRQQISQCWEVDCSLLHLKFRPA